jgi:hypothetical protein
MISNYPLPPRSLLSLSPLETAIWRTIAYVDMFDYPLTLAEIHYYLDGIPATRSEIEAVLNNGRLVPDYLTSQPPYYMLSGREDLGQIRQRRTTVSQKLWPGAVRYGRLIASMPFVRMVAVTGSLAVNNVDDRSDIDYLIVTKKGRVWLSRAFIIAIVRMAARQGWALCPNYILSETALAFADRDLYTAHELVQMTPLYGLPVYRQMRWLNSWTSQFMPNADGIPLAGINLPAPYPSLQKALELPWRTSVGQWADTWEMDRKIRKFRRYPSCDADFNQDRCKGHFDQHKQRILEAYYDRSQGGVTPET